MDEAIEAVNSMGAALQGADEEGRREAARRLGAARTPRKAASSSENLARARSLRPFKPLAAIPCTCGAGESLEHKSTCPRGRTIRRRRKLGQPLA